MIYIYQKSFPKKYKSIFARKRIASCYSNDNVSLHSRAIFLINKLNANVFKKRCL